MIKNTGCRKWVTRNVKFHMQTEYRRWGNVDCRFLEREEFFGELQYLSGKRIGAALYKDGMPVMKIWQRKGIVASLTALAVILFVGYRFLPYGVWAGAREIGRSISYSRRKGFAFEIRGNTYVLREHSHNVGSLTKNDRQIARYAWSYGEGVLIECMQDDNLEISLTFGILFFTLFHANKRGWHTTIFFHDKYAYLADWHGGDEED